MPDNKSEETLLLIRCPSCGQRFKVNEDLRDRTVECGGCEHRFRITDEVIVRGRKFYPGERSSSELNRFKRVPLAIAASLDTQSARYGEAPNLQALEPTSPQRVIAGICGGVAIAVLALLLVLGAKRGGALDGVTTENRLIMAAFTCVLATILLVYGNPRARAKAFGMSLVISIGLMLLPFFFTGGSVPLGSQNTESDWPQAMPPANELAEKETDAITELRRRIGPEPLIAEINRLKEQGSTRTAVGLWLRDLQERNRFLIMEYILRVTGADPQSHYYPRGKGDFLLVVSGTNQSIDEIAEFATALGSVERIVPQLSIIEVKVNNDNFVEGPVEKLTDRESPDFYDLNKRELESIDLDRIERAVKRLAEAEPKIYRNDISHRLIKLLAMPEVKFKGVICKALATWADDLDSAAAAALVAAENLKARNAIVPEEMIAILVKAKNPGVIPIIHSLWSETPTRWETQYSEIGPAAEPTLLRSFPTLKGWHRQSAVRLLGRVGSADSLELLESAKADADPELRVLLDKSIQAIQSRL